MTSARTIHTARSPRTDPQTDRECLEHIVYDLSDAEMMNGLRPTIEESQPIVSQDMALDYIGKRGAGAWGREQVVERVAESTLVVSSHLHAPWPHFLPHLP